MCGVLEFGNEVLQTLNQNLQLRCFGLQPGRLLLQRFVLAQHRQDSFTLALGDGGYIDGWQVGYARIIA